MIKAVTDSIANGNYLNSNGLTGDDVWGKRATWCMMYGKMKSDSISVLMIDHPKNEVYPTYWHARGYGLFAANPMGANVFNKSNPVYQRTLQPGESITFRYRVVFAAGKKYSIHLLFSRSKKILVNSNHAAPIDLRSYCRSNI